MENVKGQKEQPQLCKDLELHHGGCFSRFQLDHIYKVDNISCSKKKIMYVFLQFCFSDVFTADILMTLTKAKNKAPSTVKTAIDSIATTPVAGRNTF